MLPMIFQIDKKPYLLSNTIQHYAWGTKGNEAFLPKLLGFESQADMAYAELWMGAHSKAPSQIKIENEFYSLEKLIQQFPNEILGKRVADKFGALPFLLKVLSAGEALSIQAHPSREQAKKLHFNGPLNYPDDNHKPEIAIVLDHLTALVGLKDKENLAFVFKDYPEIYDFLGDKVKREYAKKAGPGLAARLVYSSYMERAVDNPYEFEKAVDALNRRIEKRSNLSEEEKLFLEMQQKYGPRDVGLFSIFLLNLVHLNAGEALFLPAGIPHAYIRGNIVECMANSDNVVRAGLTYKFTDVKTLLEILDFKNQPDIQSPLKGETTITYKTDVDDFKILKIDLKAGNSVNETGESVQVLLVTDGNVRLVWEDGNSSMRVKRGESVLIPALLAEYTITTGSLATIFLAQVP